MNDLSDLCFLCLVYDKNIKLKENDYLKMREEFQYFIPEPILHNSEIPKYVCNDCINSLNKTNAFRRKCLKNIAIYNEYEQKLTQYSGSQKYLTIVLTDILHPNNAELNCDIEIKTEIFGAEDSKIQNDTKNYETCKVTENEKLICDELNFYREIKNEICQTNKFNLPTENQTGEIFNDIEINDKIDDNYIQHEINEEFIIKEEDELEDFSGIHNVEQQKPFCSQIDLFNQNVPKNSSENINDFTVADSMCIQNQEHSRNIEMIKCKKCSKTYSNNEDLKIHYRSHAKKLHICDLCQKTFSTSSYLKIHKLAHAGEKPHVCNFCQKAFTLIQSLKKHKRVHTDERPYVCDVCQKAFRYSSNLTGHKRLHIGEKTHACDTCQKTFNRIEHLKKHKLHVCGVSQEAFNQINKLKSHKLTYSGDKPHECDVCQKTFDRINVLKQHKLMHSERSYKCDVCPKTFSQIGYLKSHKLVHMNEKPHACDTCQKTFRRKFSLKVHKLAHTGVKPYACDVCQKKFSYLSHLKTHLLAHTGENPYVCDICQKAFYRTDMLKRHKLIHSGDKLHACDACQKVFRRKDHLRKHKRTKCGVMMT